MTAYYVRLFGPVQVECDGEAVRGFESEKAQALLGYLAVQQRPVSRRHLAALFWGNKPEQRALGNLRRVLHNLTQIMPNCLDVTRQSVTFRLSEDYQTDAARFERLMVSDDPSDLAEAVGLYRADFMEGMSLSDCPEFDIWLVGEQEVWRQRVIQCLRALIVHHRQRGEYELGIRFATRLLALAPWWEEGHRQMMLMLAHSGQRAAALAQFERCRRILQQELGVAPSQETMALYERIRNTPAPRHNLPLEATPFVGRQEELAEIAQYLANSDCRLITIVGPGGVGKPRLALKAARDRIHSFLHGVFVVPLATLERPSLLPMAMANALGVPLKGRELPRQQLLNYLQGKELLLVLDNLEHLLRPEHVSETTSLVVAILRAASGVKLMVTSRQRLNLRWEWLLEIGGLDYPSGEAVADTSHSAVELFLQSALRVNRRFAPEGEMDAIVRICHLLEGLPLGIELAAAWVKGYSCREIAHQIAHNLDSLHPVAQDYSVRHKSLRAVCDHSWELLSPQEQHAFRRLAIFPGSFDPNAAVYIVQVGRSTLTSLVEKSLLQEDAGGRCQLHAVLKRYAAEQLRPFPQEATATKARFSTYYADFLHHLEADLQSGHQKSALQAIETEIENLRSAWNWAVAQKDTGALRKSTGSLYHFFEMRGWYQEGEATFGAAVHTLQMETQELPSAQEEHLLGYLLACWGWFQHRVGDDLSAIRTLSQSIDVFRSLGDEERLAFALANLADAARTSGDLEQAARWLDESLTLYRRLEHPFGMARVLNVLGIVASIEGEHAAARERFEESLRLHREIGDPFGMALALNNLGIVLDESGELEAARNLYLECLKIREELGDTYGMAAVLGNLGIIADSQGKLKEAQDYFEHCLRIAREFNYRSMIAGLLNNLGALDIKRGAYTMAERRFQESLEISSGIGDRRRMALTLNRLGRAQLEGDRLAQAEASFQQALRLARDVQAMPVLLESLIGLAAILLREGEAERALAWLIWVQRHPAGTRDTVQNVTQLKEEVESRLTHNQVCAAQEAADQLELESLVESALSRTHSGHAG
jgi:predicted ATPase